jgi:hypothetical protein
MTLWVVKGGADGEREMYNLSHKVSTFGWIQLPDLAALGSLDAIRDAIRTAPTDRPGATDGAVTNWSAQAFSFAIEIEPGDLIAMPLKTTPRTFCRVRRRPRTLCLRSWRPARSWPAPAAHRGLAHHGPGFHRRRYPAIAAWPADCLPAARSRQRSTDQGSAGPVAPPPFRQSPAAPSNNQASAESHFGRSVGRYDGILCLRQSRICACEAGRLVAERGAGTRGGGALLVQEGEPCGEAGA